ncbi:hypothetical protein ITP53_25940 [Nonomuraea sp. K274]|uniref:Uncharacterized protein n=1 Tax=Nonomuraea cypriaca TaxID=1187855 RepID=A0A931F114_9ACTN|nr:hypothetical protein [Nonomuraea cypriaca]MBF8189112.1 hypothetical protein [Nonomuraea cypriaca]
MHMESRDTNPVIENFIMDSIERGSDWKQGLEYLEFILTECTYVNDNGTIRKLMRRFKPMGFVRARALLQELPIERDDLGRWVHAA